jgi:hypothetical protein
MIVWTNTGALGGSGETTSESHGRRTRQTRKAANPATATPQAIAAHTPTAASRNPTTTNAAKRAVYARKSFRAFVVRRKPGTLSRNLTTVAELDRLLEG